MSAVEQCPHREEVRLSGAGDESARCALLSRIVACGQELASLRVPRGACEACIVGIPPAVDRLNPVLASFLYSAAAEIVEQGGIGACSAERGAELKAWARSAVAVEVSDGRALQNLPRTAQNCCYLGGLVGSRQQASPAGLVRTPVFACRHPDHDLTTEANCGACRDWSRSEAPPRPLWERLPPPPSWERRGPIRWAVGVTTAPRTQPTLERTLETLERAGWDGWLLAVDGSTRLPPTRSHGQISLRTPAVGAWPNFYLTLLELLLTRPDADAFLMIQDDALFYDRENLRDYLESALWPSEPEGIVSLYCSAAYTSQTPGWRQAAERWGWGALAFLFPAGLARRFVCDPEVIRHRSSDRGLRFIDDVIGEWAERTAVPIWHPTPSLVQHIGETSTVWPGVAAAGYRRADAFAGDL